MWIQTRRLTPENVLHVASPDQAHGRRRVLRPRPGWSTARGWSCCPNWPHAGGSRRSSLLATCSATVRALSKTLDQRERGRWEMGGTPGQRGGAWRFPARRRCGREWAWRIRQWRVLLDGWPRLRLVEQLETPCPSGFSSRLGMTRDRFRAVAGVLRPRAAGADDSTCVRGDAMRRLCSNVLDPADLRRAPARDPEVPDRDGPSQASPPATAASTGSGSRWLDEEAKVLCTSRRMG